MQLVEGRDGPPPGADAGRSRSGSGQNSAKQISGTATGAERSPEGRRGQSFPRSQLGSRYAIACGGMPKAEGGCLCQKRYRVPFTNAAGALQHGPEGLLIRKARNQAVSGFFAALGEMQNTEFFHSSLGRECMTAVIAVFVPSCRFAADGSLAKSLPGIRHCPCVDPQAGPADSRYAVGTCAAHTIRWSMFPCICNRSTSRARGRSGYYPQTRCMVMWGIWPSGYGWPWARKPSFS